MYAFVLRIGENWKLSVVEDVLIRIGIMETFCARHRRGEECVKITIRKLQLTHSCNI